MRRLFIWSIVILFALTTLSGCMVSPQPQDIQQRLDTDKYELESVARNGNQQSLVYRAVNETVPQVARSLTEQARPLEQSAEDEQQMFLLYSDELYSLQRDEAQPSDTLVEVSNREFVQQNYSLSFLQGYLLGSALTSLFDFGRSYPGTYRGYTARGQYRPAVGYRAPTVDERRSIPPLTKNGVGTVIKRSSGGLPAGTADTVPRQTVPPTGGNQGTIRRAPDGSTNVSPRSSEIMPPKSNSPPRTRRGTGRVRRR